MNAAMNNHDKSKLTQPRPVCESISEMTEIVLPNDANPLDALLGGRLMHWIDLAGAMAAHRHSRTYVVTASVDHMDFLVPVRVGDFVVLRSSVNRVFNTSMEVGVKAWVENYRAEERRHVSSAYLTFVAVDAAGNRIAVPPVVPETADEKRRYDGAARRREIRRTEAALRNQVRI
jgi:acyl-CoA hydrolase